MNVTSRIPRGGRPVSVALILILAASAAHTNDIPEDTCNHESIIPSMPSSVFTVIGDGSIVLDERTGLEWRRCAEGMTWNDKNGTCVGDADEMNWQAALEYTDGIDGWRLPDIKELTSIQERCRTVPSTNRQVFPDTPSRAFWSASPYAPDSDNVRYAGFINGAVWYRSKGDDATLVRLVRVAQ